MYPSVPTPRIVLGEAAVVLGPRAHGDRRDPEQHRRRHDRRPRRGPVGEATADARRARLRPGPSLLPHKIGGLGGRGTALARRPVGRPPRLLPVPPEVVDARHERQHHHDPQRSRSRAAAGSRYRRRAAAGRSPPPGRPSSPCPAGDAGISTPRPAATLRRPVTANSRPRMIITIQAGTASISTRDRNAAAVSSLSASGSSRMPEAGHLVAPAREIAVEVVGEHGQAEDRRRPGRARLVRGRVRRTTTRTGTRKMRSTVRAFGRFTTSVDGCGPSDLQDLGRTGCPGWRCGCRARRGPPPRSPGRRRRCGRSRSPRGPPRAPRA